jgi:tRNA pseudouridine55 synthase
MNGVLNIDKPAGLTSHDVVNRVRRILGERSVGHLGTLDPMATGVLPLVVGSFTRLAQFYTDSDKTYEGVIRFGFSTSTYDAEGDTLSEPYPVSLEAEQVQELAKQFRGKFHQLPPPVSAKKIGGVRAYKLARKHQEVRLEPVLVEVKELVILAISGDQLCFRAHVGSGTYLRSIAHEMGKKLGCGAHLASLRRTAVAEFAIADAVSLEDLDAAARQGTADHKFVHPRALLPHMPCVTANDQSIALIRNGRPVNLPEISGASLVKVFQAQRDLIAIGRRIAGTLFHPSIVFSANAD